jgi:hypothetical protein
MGTEECSAGRLGGLGGVGRRLFGVVGGLLRHR